MAEVMLAREALMHLLIGGKQERLAAVWDIESTGEWRSVIDLAARWGMIPQLHAWITSSGILINEGAGRDLAERLRNASSLSVLVAQTGVEHLRRLAEAGIATVLFKGMASIAHLYSGPGERTIRDTDILVREEDLERCVEALERMSVAPAHEGDLAAYRSSIRWLPGFAGNESLACRCQRFELDLHWRLGPATAPELRVERIMDRAVPATILGQTVHVVCPVDGLVLSAHHAIRENMAPDGMIKDLIDIGLWLDLIGRMGRLDEAIRHVDRSGLGPAVYAAATILGRPENLGPLASALGRELVDLFWLQTRQGPVGNDLAHAADPHALMRFFRGALTGWRSYRRQMARFEIKLSGQRIPISRRILATGARLTELNLSKWRMLRALAKAKADYQYFGR